MAPFTIGRFLLITYVFLSVAVLNKAEIHRIRKPPSSKLLVRHHGGELADVETADTDTNDRDYLDDNHNGEQKDFVCAIVATVLVGLTGILPLALPLDSRHVDSGTDGTRRLNLFLSFAVGGLLGDVFLHLLPEAFAHFKPGDRSARVTHGVLLIAGMLVFYILEVIFSEKEEEEVTLRNATDVSPMSVSNGHAMSNGTNTTTVVQRHPHKEGLQNGLRKDSNDNGVKQNGHCSHSHEENPTEGKKQVTGYLNLLANFIDNFTHGLAVGGSFMVSSTVGWHTTLAILLHEAPHEIGDFAILLRSGFSRWDAAKAQMSTSVGGLIGCAVALLAESAEVAGTNSAWILPFTSGGFLNIALVTIVPDLMKETSAKESIKQVLCLILGVAVMALVSVVSDH